MAWKSIFTTRADLVPGLERIEAKIALKYVQTGAWRTPTLLIYDSALEIPGLGHTENRNVYAARSFLVMPRDAPDPTIRVSDQVDGSKWYCVEASQNPATFVLQPGGWYHNLHLMGGGIRTAVENPDMDTEALTLYRSFARTVTKGFIKVRDWQGIDWWLGPEALEALKNGVRLVTTDLSAPDTLEDLTLPTD